MNRYVKSCGNVWGFNFKLQQLSPGRQKPVTSDSNFKLITAIRIDHLATQKGRTREFFVVSVFLLARSALLLRALYR